jgi:hypothetical protein
MLEVSSFKSSDTPHVGHGDPQIHRPQRQPLRDRRDWPPPHCRRRLAPGSHAAPDCEVSRIHPGVNHPALSVGEAYMDGRLVIEEGSIYDFLDVLARNAVVTA